MTVGDFGSFNSGHLIINSGATCQFTNLAIFFETVVDNYGQFILRGNDLLGLSALLIITELQTFICLFRLLRMSVMTSPEDVHAIETKAAMNRGILIGFNPDALIGQDGNNLISQDGNNVVSKRRRHFRQSFGWLDNQPGWQQSAVRAGSGDHRRCGSKPALGRRRQFHQDRVWCESYPSRNATSPSGRHKRGSPGSGYVQEAGNTDLSVASIIGHVTLNGGVLSGSGVIAGDLTNNGGYIVPESFPWVYLRKWEFQPRQPKARQFWSKAWRCR